MRISEPVSKNLLESCLLSETAHFVSDILGIRVHIDPSGKGAAVRTGSFFKQGWIFRMQWEHVAGTFSLFLDQRFITDLLAIESGHPKSGKFQRILKKFACWFAEGLSRKLTCCLKEPWKIQAITVLPFLNIRDAMQPSEIGRLYEVSTGAQISFPVFTTVSLQLLKTWAEHLRYASAEHVMSRTDDFHAIVPMISKHIQIPAEPQWQESLEVELPVSAQLGQTRIQLKRVLDLGPGDVLRLNKLDGDPVDLYVNNQKFAEGRIVETDGKVGIQVIALIGQEDRVRQLYPSGF